MLIVNTLIFLNKLNGPSEGYENEEDEEKDEDSTIKEPLISNDEEKDEDSTIKESNNPEIIEELENSEPTNDIGKLTDINDDTDTKSIKDKIKKVIPENDDTPLDINKINRQINKLTSILE